MTTKEIIDLLKEREADFMKTNSFSKLSGIYAFFFIGNNFPHFEDQIKRHEIIYIGKTEASQEKRNAKTHFTSGKTGSSTVRKSIGAILQKQENLTPIPRNDSDYGKGRYSHFKFDSASEETITKWMKNNLALSFYEFPENKQLMDKLESEIIQELKPILNIDYKNPDNTFKEQIKHLRKICAMIAFNSTDSKGPFSNPISLYKIKSNISEFSSRDSILINNITESDVKRRIIRVKVENKHLFPAERKGNPTSYSLDFKFEKTDFIVNYTIGSKDGKSRSGILKFADNTYNRTLNIQSGTTLKICKLDDNKYTIEK